MRVAQRRQAAGANPPSVQLDERHSAVPGASGSNPARNGLQCAPLSAVQPVDLRRGWDSNPGVGRRFPELIGIFVDCWVVSGLRIPRKRVMEVQVMMRVMEGLRLRAETRGDG